MSTKLPIVPSAHTDTVENSLTKSCFVKGMRCQKALYFHKFHPEFAQAETVMDERIKRQGIQVGEYARRQFADGVLIESHDTEQALQETQDAIRKGALTLFEAAFKTHGVVVRVDILTRSSVSAPWQLREIKATTYSKREKADVLEIARDIAIQVWVLEQSGIRIKAAFLMHVNRECVYPNLEDLFVVKNFGEEIAPLLRDMDRDVQALQGMLRKRVQPDIDIGSYCEKPRDCEFKDVCWRDVSHYSVFDFPNLRNKWALYKQGKCAIEQLSEGDFKSEMQLRALHCYQTGQPFIDVKMAQQHIQSWAYPISYFDIEAIAYPIPQYPKSRPYQDIPFQFSCHIQRDPKAVLEHHEFLHDDESDPRLEFIKAMLSVLPSDGAIVTYHKSYEEGRLKDLAKDFPEYAEAIQRLLSRIVDIKVVIQDAVYYPEFLGSFSIKKVAPVLLGQKASYEDLAVGEGLEAVCRYEEMIDLEQDDGRRLMIKKDLLEYCKQDTILMVWLHQWLQKQVTSSC